jgi:hypothetical protein
MRAASVSNRQVTSSSQGTFQAGEKDGEKLKRDVNNCFGSTRSVGADMRNGIKLCFGNVMVAYRTNVLYDVNKVMNI